MLALAEHMVILLYGLFMYQPTYIPTYYSFVWSFVYLPTHLHTLCDYGRRQSVIPRLGINMVLSNTTAVLSLLLTDAAGLSMSYRY